MKKLLVIGAMCAVSALGAYASKNHKTWCGELVQTVEDAYFDSEEEAEDYYTALDIIYCGSENPNP